MFDGRFRAGVDRTVKPIGRALERTGLSPNHLTVIGLALAVPAAVAVGAGRLGLGLALLILSAVTDLLDGALARAAGQATVRGAFLDSVCDRVTDGLILGGFAWYLQSRHGGHAFMLPLAVLGVSLLVSYERAKAESLGLSAKGGLMERAERLVLLCTGLAFSFLLVPLLWVMLVLTGLTAVQRFVKVWRQAGAPAPQRMRAADDATALAVRWRAWREANGWAPGTSRYVQGSTRAGTRWHERRQRRLARLADEGREPIFGRRPGSRRP